MQSPLAAIGGHSRAVSYVRFMGCGRRLLTASTDSALKLWDIAAEVARPASQPSVPDLTFSGVQSSLSKHPNSLESVAVRRSAPCVGPLRCPRTLPVPHCMWHSHYSL